MSSRRKSRAERRAATGHSSYGTGPAGKMSAAL
nr:MAG TPA: hypothetical protein [Inoviridae sp.]